MKEKKINRRGFLVRSAQGAAGFGVLAGCDKRSNFIGTDSRILSTPQGLKKTITKTDVVSVTLSWNPHDRTDITGAKKDDTTEIRYNLYKDDVLLKSGIQGTSYTDTSVFVENSSYTYSLSATQISDGIPSNESPKCPPVVALITPFSDVFVVKKSTVASGTAVNSSVLKTMLNALIMGLTNKTTVASAWESLFPGLTTQSLIGLKVNTLGGSNLSTKPALVDAIAAGLTQMLGNTFPAYNIIVFDDRYSGQQMKGAGFITRNEPGKYRIVCIRENTTLGTGTDLWCPAQLIAGVSQRISKLVEGVDYIVNIPVLKNHDAAGITFSMKNLYGIVDAPSKLHGTMCSPFIPALYNTEVGGVALRDKIRVIIGDAIFGCSVGGPSANLGIDMKPYTLVASTDPVAIDSWALDTINSFRSAQVPVSPQISLSASTDKSPDARHILAAVQEPYKLGYTSYSIKEIAV